MLLASQGLAAQSFLERFSYEGLGLSGIGGGVGLITSDRLTREVIGNVRIDYGVIAPRVRVLVGAAYFKGLLADDEITKFETSLRRVVTDPTNDATIDIGQITWADLSGDLDLQYLAPIGSRYLMYAGLGVNVHIRNASGVAIANTFVEDALDTVSAGGTASFGFEVAFAPRLTGMIDLRGGLSSELRTLSLGLGLMYRVRPWMLQ
jgi:hypothetical protein